MAISYKPWLQNLNFLGLQESVNSSEDLSAKTKSVIELKKLQLLPLQRRVRRLVVVGEPPPPPPPNHCYSFVNLAICLFNILTM
jgi:hypothetical protein